MEKRRRRRFKQTVSLEDRLAREAQRLRKQAQGTPQGFQRERLIRRAKQLETASRLSQWMSLSSAHPHSKGCPGAGGKASSAAAKCLPPRMSLSAASTRSGFCISAMANLRREAGQVLQKPSKERLLCFVCCQIADEWALSSINVSWCGFP